MLEFDYVFIFLDYFLEEIFMEKTITLSDGRKMSLSAYGDEKGKAVFFFHGWPGSRVAMGHFEKIFADKGLWMITCERPGIGKSDFQENRSILDIAKDIEEVADSLNLEKFSVIGHSGGGPYAMACAFQLSDKIDKVMLLAATSPVNRKNATKNMMFTNKLLFFIAKKSEGIFSKIVKSVIANGEEKFLAQMESALPNSDKDVINDMRDVVLEDIREGICQPDGFVHDFYILAQDWGFDLSKIDKTIEIWHGTEDVNVPMQMSEYYSEVLPNASLTKLEAQGHFLLYSNMDKIAEYIVE